jgi:PAS domain S-box-containing protein
MNPENRIRELEEEINQINIELEKYRYEHRGVSRWKEKRRLKKRRFDKIFYSSPSFMFISKLIDGIFIEVNDACCRLLDYSREELIGQSSLELGILTPEARKNFREELEKEGRVRQQEIQFYSRNGEVKDTIASMDIIEFSGEKHIICSGIDITKRIQNEEELREINERLSAAIDGGELGTWELDLKTGIATHSLRHDQIWGYPEGAADWGIDTAMENVVPEDHVLIKEAYDQAMETGVLSHENRITWPDGSVHWIAANGRVRYDEKGNPVRITGVVADITDRKQSEEALLEKQKFYENFAEAMPQMAFIADPKGNIVYYNNKWYEYLGDMEGTEGWGWKDKQVHHPEDLQRTIDSWTHCLKSGEPYEIEYRLRRHDGIYRWHLGRSNPVRDIDGNIKLWIGTNTDIHEQAEAREIVKKTGELYENLLYITTHDLKGPVANMHLALNAIENIDDIDKKLQVICSIRQLADQMENNIRGVTEIIQVQKADKSSARKIHLDVLVNEILNELKEELDDSLIITDFSKKKSVVYIEIFLVSIIRNLIDNSIKYSRNNVRLKIEIITMVENDYTVLIVKDNGIGIDLDKHRDLLFTPFKRFGAKRVYGTGIGLYMIKNIIEKNGGYIEAKSVCGEGTTFYCYLKEY